MNLPTIALARDIEFDESIEITRLNPEDIIPDFHAIAPIEDPLLLLYIGFIICLLSGLGFAYLMRKKLISWEKKKISPLPLGNTNTIITWSGFFTGLTLLFTGALQIFDFQSYYSLIFSISISLLFGITMWKAILDLMVQVERGEVKEIDEYF